MRILGVVCVAICLICTGCVVATKPDMPGETRIVIDGQADDWKGREAIVTDPAGDAKEGFIDITTVYAFINQDALYFLVEMTDPTLAVEQFDFELDVDDKKYLVSWMPGESAGGVGDITEGYSGDAETGYLPSHIIGQTVFSSLALGDSLEARIDLRDLGSPESVALTEIRVMGGECCAPPEWYYGDVVNPVETPGD